MQTQKNCRHLTLAQNGAAHIQRCDECGCVSVHLGPFTVRLDDAGLDALWAVLGDAAAALSQLKDAERGHRAAPGSLAS